MALDADWLKWGLMALLNLAGSYGAIRARLNALDKRCDETAGELAATNKRIDDILLKR